MSRNKVVILTNVISDFERKLNVVRFLENPLILIYLNLQFSLLYYIISVLFRICMLSQNYQPQGKNVNTNVTASLNRNRFQIVGRTAL